MPRGKQGRLNADITKRLILNAGELFGDLGIELKDEQREKIEKRKAYEAKRTQQKRDYYETHREEILARAKVRAKERQEEIRAYQAVYRACNKAKAQAYREARRESIRAYARAWYISHREEILVKRRARKAEQSAQQNSENV